MTLLDVLAPALARAGLNHVGVVGRARYDAAAPLPLRTDRVHPGTRSIVVVGSGGREHWSRFLEWLAVDPVSRLAARAHPLDDFTAATFAAVGGALEGCRTFFPTQGAPVHLDFMRLAALAGLGAPSELGILVSPRFGPWLGLRAAVFAPFDLDETAPVARACDGCSAPCRRVCPAAAVGPTFSWPSCVATRQRPASPCQAHCGARDACVIAPDERYEPLEILYHYDRPAGRRCLCARFDVEDRTLAE